MSRFSDFVGKAIRDRHILAAVDIVRGEAWGVFVIQVVMAPEPTDFDDRVRVPGKAFLASGPPPRQEKDWKNKDFWTRVLPDMRRDYRSICAYAALWIPNTTGSPTVDHFIPKSADPDNAYEWANYRLACLLMNTRKRAYRDVLDPFEIEAGWFILDFDTFMINPNPALPDGTKRQITATIKRLKLNDDEACVQARREWYEECYVRHKDFSLLERRAPFVAFELQRQGLAPET